ncbi:doublecortin domain-containing protein 2B [Sebastes umbrosus]|uniref:doublecortin domain-containing protein 2B n=1 Tax=Sebastes umbrosus TaxID=72105 RepID=UPI00189E9F43|nr:doublecortin domain-containing protein 2B [Sebastes umbrosus]XP_037603350.1 doublecortin domain-containing protein 2B [Sebastes umbrosus]XP_037603351.1 doublecortin domain-containing protein 2B [Sebastes umbrosus]XP_037603352.1 doublecortin domain-containing protein 2B [Sebastes umbrosus]
MAASTAAMTLLPPVKNVVVYRNGDPFYIGRRFVVNQRQVATMDAFLTEVTQSIGAQLAVRTLYTPRQGHRVTDLQDLQTGAQYVAAGFERFKKLDYLNARTKKQPAAREETQAKVTQRPNVSAKWRKFIPLPCIIHIFRNGDLLCPPFRFIIPRSMPQDLELILSLVTDKVSLRTGAVRRLCSMEGATVTSAVELETGHCYVAVGTERFKKLPYVELMVSKATERYYPGKRRLLRRNENRKAGSGPEDQYSDSALLDSPESDGRRVKSTGDEAPAAVQQRSRRHGGDETSAFFARPVKIRNNRGQPRPPLSNGSVQPIVFKRAARKRREEVRGAEEVHEDENTAIELPVDQRVAEIVEDEELNNHNDPLHNTQQQRHAQITESEQHNGREHPHKHNGEQALSSEQDDVKQTENSARTEAAEILEPELQQTSSKSRPSSSTSQGQNREEKESSKDAPSVTVEQNHHQED